MQKSTKSNVIEIGQLSQIQLKLKLILNYYNQTSIDLSDTKEKCKIKSTKYGRHISVYLLPEDEIHT